MITEKRLTVVQMLPALDSGGVERGTLEIARALVAAGHRSIVISAGGRMVDQLVREGSEHIAWPVGHKRLSTLGYIGKVRKLLAEEKVDILHLRSRLPAWIGYLAWKGLPAAARPRLVTTVHGPYTPGRYSAVMVKGERVIAVSEMIRGYIAANYPGTDMSKVTVIHRGVSRSVYPHGFQPDAAWLTAWNAQFPQTVGKTLITLPARITRWKGQQNFIELISRLRATHPQVHGLIVGEPHPRKRAFYDELVAEVASRGLGDAITFTGHRSDLREIMAISHIVLSLSLQPEAFGRTTIEALSLGRPVVAYDHGGVAEQLLAILPEGLVSVGDMDTLTARVNEWIQSPPTVPAEHDFTLERMCDQTLAIYEVLAHERRPA